MRRISSIRAGVVARALAIYQNLDDEGTTCDDSIGENKINFLFL